VHQVRSKALWVVAVLLALNAVLMASVSTAAVPRNLTPWVLGPKLVRMDVVVMEGGQPTVFRIDRGRVRLVRPGLVRLLERDGTVVTISVAPDAEVTLNGRAVALTALRRNTMVTTVRLNGDEPAGRVAAGAVPRNLAWVLGSKLVRMDVVVMDAGRPTVFRIDRGRVRLVRPGFVRLLERDGTVVTIPVAPGADVTRNGRAVALTALRRGMTATTVRLNGEAPAERVEARR